MEETKLYYKGFEKGLVCRGHQYKEGEWEHIADEAILCEQGVHACEAPLDCLNYYDPVNSEFHVVELKGVSNKHDDDSKVVATDIKVGAKLDIAGIVKAQFEFTKSKTRSNNSGGNSSALTGGDWSALTGGNWSALTGGNRSALTGGDRSALTGGDWSALTGGDRSALTGGDWSVCYGGENAKVKGGLWSVLAIQYWKDCELIDVKTAVVDGKAYKPNTWYTLNENGEFVEVD